ncbi:MAG: hypothetical protein GX575_09245 [Candidatus Anammoximicrobium sp.]|nr:hypothetical protein [Candidatus Anammoximicrobium sp.]
MTVQKILLASGLIVLLCLVPAALHAQVTADDFLPPVTGGPTDVKQPDKVAMKGDTVTAASAQDAINVAVKENVKELKDDIEEVGARMVSFPSGLGFVATGAAFYREMPNPTATRIAKRQAYVMAFVKAKKNLAEILGGLSNEGKESVREQLVNINLPEQEMTNISTQSEEALRQTVDMMLRGFVIYEVKDDTANSTVYVTIVTTPKTRGKFARPAPNRVEAESLRDGVNQVIAEVRSGLVPPVGGRIITMRSTGETAFVGFGSSVVRTSENRVVQLRHNLDAQKIAGMRAKDALCGLIIGDKTMWEGSVTESMKDDVQEFESLVRDDPLARKDPTAVRKLDQARQTFVSRMESSDVYASARKGILPPGVNTKTWFDEDHAWSYGMSVYVPSLTNAAAGAARQMRESTILQPVDDGSDRPSSVPDRNMGGIKQPGKDVRKGPTGRISPDGL